MVCPECFHSMKKVRKGNVVDLHCTHCGHMIMHRHATEEVPRDPIDIAVDAVRDAKSILDLLPNKDGRKK